MALGLGWVGRKRLQLNRRPFSVHHCFGHCISAAFSYFQKHSNCCCLSTVTYSNHRKPPFLGGGNGEETEPLRLSSADEPPSYT